MHTTFGLSGVVGGSLTNALATTLFTNIKANGGVTAYMARLLPSSSLQGLTLVDYNAPGNIAGGVATGTALAGTSAAADNLSSHLACVVTMYTASKGKSYRGRAYMPGLTEADNDINGLVVATTQTLAANFVNGIKTVISAQNPLAMAIVSFALVERPAHDGSTLPAKPAFTTPVTSITVRQPQWGSQRARQRRK